MDKSQKSAQIEDIKDKFDRMISAVLVNYEGLDVASVTELRDQFREAGVEYKVVKNTLVRHAIKEKDYADALAPSLTKMTAIAWSYEDPSAAAKVVTKFMKDNPALQIKAGVIETQVLDAKAVENTLAKMPGKNELRATLLATLQAPAQQLVALLQAPAQQMALVLDAKKRQDEKAG